MESEEKELVTESGDGDCYVAAGRLVMHMHKTGLRFGVRLVHGIVSGQMTLQGKRFGHAWVEYGDVVFDHSNGKKLTVRKDAYYEVGEIKEEEVVRYDWEEMAIRTCYHKHWGPWHE